MELEENWTSDVSQFAQKLLDTYASPGYCKQSSAAFANVAEVIRIIYDLMDHDSKDGSLKALQGMVLRHGFESSALQGELLDDVVPAIKSWTRRGIRVVIYSSGSVAVSLTWSQPLHFAFIGDGFSGRWCWCRLYAGRVSCLPSIVDV